MHAHHELRQTELNLLQPRKIHSSVLVNVAYNVTSRHVYSFRWDHENMTDQELGRPH